MNRKVGEFYKYNRMQGINTKRVVVSSTSNTAVHVTNPVTRTVCFNVDSRTSTTTVKGTFNIQKGQAVASVDASNLTENVSLIVPSSGSVILGGPLRTNRLYAHGGLHKPDYAFRLSRAGAFEDVELEGTIVPFKNPQDVLYFGFAEANPGSLVFSVNKVSDAMVEALHGNSPALFSAINLTKTELLGNQPFSSVSEHVLINAHVDGSEAPLNGVHCQSWVGVAHVSGTLSTEIGNVMGVGSGPMLVPEKPIVLAGTSRKRAQMSMVSSSSTSVQGNWYFAVHPIDTIDMTFVPPPYVDISGVFSLSVFHENQVHISVEVHGTVVVFQGSTGKHKKEYLLNTGGPVRVRLKGITGVSRIIGVLMECTVFA